MTKRIISVLLCAVLLVSSLFALSVASFAGDKKTDDKKTETTAAEEETISEESETAEEIDDTAEVPEDDAAYDVQAPAGTEDTSSAETDSASNAETEKKSAFAISVTDVSYDAENGKLSVSLKNDGEKISQSAVYITYYDASQITFSDSVTQNITYNGAAQAAVLFGMDRGETVSFDMNAEMQDPEARPVISMAIQCFGNVVGCDDESDIITVGDIFAAANSDSAKNGSNVTRLLKQTGFYNLFSNFGENWKTLVMIAIACVLIYLAIGKGFEPLLLLPIAFGMLLTNLPGAEMFHEALFAGGHVHWDMFASGSEIAPGLIDYLYLGVKLGIYPCLIFVGVGAMTDFAPLIANPKSLLLGAAAQLGIFLAFGGAVLLGFTSKEASSIGIIGGADGPTAIYVTSKLAPALLGPIAVAAYSYMALVPVIQPPIMKLLTTKEERRIKMTTLRTVSKKEKIIFPIAVTVFVAFLIPSAAPLVGSLMLGNLLKECGVTERLSKTVQNELMNIVTIFLGISVGATATANTFLSLKTLGILAMGVCAFAFGTAGGVLLAKLMNLFLPKDKKINPLIGSAGVSAVPMAARVSQVVGQKEDPSNFLLMHAMGPNVAGVIGSAIAAGALIALFG